jgi:hypothetical protein
MSRITEHHEPFYAEFDGNMKVVQGHLILGDIIRGLEVDVEDIA